MSSFIGLSLVPTIPLGPKLVVIGSYKSPTYRNISKYEGGASIINKGAIRIGLLLSKV